MPLFIVARFHAKPGAEADVEAALLANLEPTRSEPGCRFIHAFRSIRDPRLFFIHSSFDDEAAFELHATLPHTVRMRARVEPLIDHALDVSRTQRIG
jgi:quinol monooxygenase YgiN